MRAAHVVKEVSVVVLEHMRRTHHVAHHTPTSQPQLIGQGEPLKIDESSLTGESLAVTRKPGDEVR